MKDKQSKSLWFSMLDKMKMNQYVMNAFDQYIESNPFSLLSYYKPERKFVYRMTEYRKWFNGDPSGLERFYKQSAGRLPGDATYLRNGFYAKVGGEMPRVHFPLPEAISQAMSTLLFNTMPRISVSSPVEKDNNSYDKLVKKVLDDNDYSTLFQKGSQLESFSGGIASKFAIDEDGVHLEFYAQDEFQLVKKFNKIKEIIFTDFIEEDKKSYRLYTHAGRGYIKYRLVKVNNQSGAEKEVSLNSIETTKNLKDIYVIGSNGKPIDILMAAYKPNRAGCNEFITSDYGSSDYEGLLSIFDAADEAYSTLADYYRNGRIFTIVSESLLEKDARGNITFNTWGINNIMRLTSTPEEAKENAERNVPDLSNVERIMDGLSKYIATACQRVGLSPATLGISDNIANISAEALTIRENVSERTRNDKIKLWQEFLTKVAKLIILYSYLNESQSTDSENGIVYPAPEAIEDLSVVVSFTPYNEETIDEKFNRLYPIYEKGFMTRDELIKRIYAGEVPSTDIQLIIEDLEKAKQESQEDIKETEKLETKYEIKQ